MQLTKEEFISNVVLPRSQTRNLSEELSKRALSEQLAKEVAEFEKRKKITQLPIGHSFEMGSAFTGSNTHEQKVKIKKSRMQNQQELLIQYAAMLMRIGLNYLIWLVVLVQVNYAEPTRVKQRL